MTPRAFEALLQALQARNLAATEGDLAAVLLPAASEELAQVPVRPPGGDDGWWLLAALAATSVCWYRCLADSQSDRRPLFVEASERTSALLALADGDETLGEMLRPLAAFGGSVLAQHIEAAPYDDREVDDAIDFLDAAVALTPVDRPDRRTLASDLSTMLQMRYSRLSRASDLDRALTAARLATDGVDDGDEHSGNAPAYFFVLGCALRLQYGRSRALVDLDQAIEADRRAVRLTPTDAWSARHRRLTNVAVGLALRYNAQKGRRDLDEAIDVARDAMRSVLHLQHDADHHPEALACIAQLHRLITARSTNTNDARDHDELVDLARLAATLAEDSATYLRLASTSLRNRFSVTGARRGPGGCGRVRPSGRCPRRRRCRGRR